MSKNTIFIQIASYRDPQLKNTLRDCIDNAKYPKNLKFCIAHQYDETEDLSEFEKDKRFIFIKIPYQDSKGACWARNQIQQKYNNEKYTLQLDSHHRFVKDWDDKCIKMIEQLQKKGFKKPLLTGYISSFNPDNDPEERIQEPWKMDFDRFTPEGVVFFLPATIDNHKELNEPVPSRFYSAHFCFTLGKFCKEVPHDPDYYFHGEEISIAVRAFTHGYDLFHPHIVVAWHEYTRRGRQKHWDDHARWHEKNAACHIRNRKLFEMDGEKRDIDFGIYGFGTERTLEDYEKYAGICFKTRGVQQYTLDRKFPPNPAIEDPLKYKESFLSVFKHCIDVGYDRLPEKDYEFLAVIFHDENNSELYRRDAGKEEIENMFKDPDGYCKIWREFNCEKKPYGWIVWPYSASRGWCDQITGTL